MCSSERVDPEFRSNLLRNTEAMVAVEPHRVECRRAARQSAQHACMSHTHDAIFPLRGFVLQSAACAVPIVALH